MEWGVIDAMPVRVRLLKVQNSVPPFYDFDEYSWLVEAAAAGTSRVKVKMAEAVTLARLHGTDRIDWALGHAAMFSRFAEGDLASILAANPPGQRRSAGDVHSLQTGTAAWHQLGSGDQR